MWPTWSACANNPMRMLIFAWGGATYPQLRSLVEFYRSRGLQTSAHITDVIDLTFRPARWRQKISPLVDAVCALPGDEPLAFHLFSNTGFLSFHEFLAQSWARGDDLLARSRVQIVESGPGIPSPLEHEDFIDLWTRSSIPILRLGRGNPEDSRYPWLVTVIRQIWRLYAHVYEWRLSAMTRAFDWFVSNPVEATYHFLYSESDEVIPVHHIERTISLLAQHGARVESRKWPNVSHASLLRKVPEAYFEYLTSALEQAGLPGHPRRTRRFD